MLAGSVIRSSLPRGQLAASLSALSRQNVSNLNPESSEHIAMETLRTTFDRSGSHSPLSVNQEVRGSTPPAPVRNAASLRSLFRCGLPLWLFAACSSRDHTALT